SESLYARPSVDGRSLPCRTHARTHSAPYRRRPIMNAVLLRLGCLIVFTVCLCVGLPTAADAKTQLLAGVIQEVDSETLKELVWTFEEAEHAMQARDVDKIMELYSDDYLYHGLKKADV